jgi:hypothetical protein
LNINNKILEIVRDVKKEKIDNNYGFSEVHMILIAIDSLSQLKESMLLNLLDT